MSYTSGLGRAINDVWECSAEGEELDLPRGEFVAKNGKAFRVTMLVGAILAIASGALLTFLLREKIGILLMVLGGCLALILPTLLSYRCLINKTLMREEYYVLFFKRRKEIFWRDISYKKITLGNCNSIKLYDKNRKRLISFDGSIVGFHRILKLTKRNGIQDIRNGRRK